MVFRKKIIIILLLTLLTPIVYAQPQTEAEELNLKAAFIYNFTRFIEWDDDIFPNEFVIGIIGNSNIDEPLEEIAQSHKAGNKKIKIKRFYSLDEIEKCNILFISKNVKISLDDVLLKPDLKKTLIIGEKESYAQLGAGINFVIIDKKLKFEVNKKSLNEAGLKVSSQLLKLAIIVN
ncbi:MAG TPA: YfiR family protein [Bacteroidia bacterium]|jgi:hypothetical protein|nr:YfiR family protein [Bacteroidia bacterium]